MAPRTSSSLRHAALGAALTLAAAAALLAVAWLDAPWELAFGNLVLRSQSGSTYPFPVAPSGELAASRERTHRAADTRLAPRNLVIVIGDGAGIGQISTASALLRGPDGRLAVEEAPVTALVKTHAGNELVTDSAAASTALATGFRVPKKAISQLSDGHRLVTLMEAAHGAGMATGVVTNSGLIDATPAGFAGHATTREDYPEILESMLTSEIDVLIGGDWSNRRKARANDRLQAMIARIDELGRASGYTVVRDARDLGASGRKLLALLPPRGSEADVYGPPLAGLAVAALNRLAATGRPFVLLAESEVTDTKGHENDIAGIVAGIAELDAAVRAVLEWSMPRGDTLVIVTADHDTGGLGILDGDYLDGVANIRWLSEGHTALWVPLFAFGPGAGRFGGVLDNTEVATVAGDLLGIEGFPSLHP